MALIRSIEDLNRLREAAIVAKKQFNAAGTIQIIIGMSSCGIAAGALKTMDAIYEQIEQMNLQNVHVSRTGCSGLCTSEPIVQLILDGTAKFAYGKVSPDIVSRIFNEHIKGGSIVRENLIDL
jgi:NADP-reducing hydrogenase subunit HndB